MNTQQYVIHRLQITNHSITGAPFVFHLQYAA
jgi:hypothetical protein